MQPDAWQENVLQSDARRMLLLCSRQSGKSTTCAALAVNQAIYDPGLVLMIAPAQRQSSELFRKAAGLLRSLDDVPRIARIKGRIAMASLLVRAVESRQRVPARVQPIEINGDTVMLEPEVIASAIRRARLSGKSYNEARVIFAKTAIASLTHTLAEHLRSQGNSLDESDLSMLREDVRSAPDARVALNTAWLPLTPEKLLQDLYARPQWLEALTPDWSHEDRELLRRERTEPFTISDIALLDEAAELLGEIAVDNSAERREAKEQRKRDIENAEHAIQNMGVKGIVNAESLAAGFAEFADAGTTAERAAADRTWAFGHIVVDEAQELSPMQWRLLLRRGPSRSFTIVGDIAQAAAASASETWEHALAPLIGQRAEGDRWRREELTVNYRTPSQIAAAAESMAIAHGLPVTKSVAVRESAWPIDTVEDAVAGVTRALEVDGTVAVIATDDRLGELRSSLGAAFPGQVGMGADGLDSAVTLLSASEAKGLEFDSVVIVDPSAIVQATERGAAALFVAMTRPTQRLVFAEAITLPDGL